MSHGRPIVRYLVMSVAIVFILIACWVGYRTWPRHFDLSPYPRFPRIDFHDARLIVRAYPRYMAAEIGAFTDELLANLDFESIKSRSFEDESSVFLAVENSMEEPIYRIFLLVDNDLLRMLSSARSVLSKVTATFPPTLNRRR